MYNIIIYNTKFRIKKKKTKNGGEKGSSQQRVWCTALITEPTGLVVAYPNDALSHN